MHIEEERTQIHITALLERFRKVRKRTQEICAPLTIEDHIPQPVYYASPAKWHLAHTTWFFEEMVLKVYAQNYTEHNPQYGFLFNSYYNLIGERTGRSDRGSITRPGVHEVYAYRESIDEAVEQYLTTENVDEKALELIAIGTHHEEQHQELLITDIKALLSQHPFHPVYKDGFDLAGGSESQEQSWIELPEGLYEIGATGQEDFVYDNELNRHRVYLHPVAISNRMVTNGEYLEFMNDGGYDQAELWLDDGWNWRKEQSVESPMYWQRKGGDWTRFSLSGLQPVRHEEILTHISFYEADAFARWKGMRLPLESEWEVLSGKFEWGRRWEWTSSPYRPYPGFNVAEGPVGEYNGKFMVNQMVMRGASVATPPEHSRRTYRNFFHPEMQWQFSGLRLAKEL
jgi:ergothioneine biosynthesis protein EgtB